MRAAFLILSLAASLAAAQDLGTVAECGQKCFNDMKGKGGCKEGDQKCLCDWADYRNGLRDCVSQSCSAADVPIVQTSLAKYVDGVCAAAVAASAPPASSTTAPGPPSSTPPPPPPSSTSSVAPPPATTSAATSSSPSPSPTSTSSTSSSAAAVTTSTSTTSSQTSSSRSGSSSSSSSSSTSSTASSTPTADAADAADPPKSEGLSTGTKAGIAIGGAAAALGLIGVLICVLLHRRNNRRRDPGNNIRLNISQPMPGSGRSYAGDHHTEKYNVSSPDPDFKSRRYEDMLPRQTPRTMV